MHRPKVIRPSSRLLALLNSPAQRISATSRRCPHRIRSRSRLKGVWGPLATPILLPVALPREQQFGVRSMNRLLLHLASAAAASSLLFSSPLVAQTLPPQEKAEHVKITKAPELELALDNMAIVRWTTTNPRGDDEHYGVVHYGTDPEDLSQTAKGHIRLNR